MFCDRRYRVVNQYLEGINSSTRGVCQTVVLLSVTSPDQWSKIIGENIFWNKFLISRNTSGEPGDELPLRLPYIDWTMRLDNKRVRVRQIVSGPSLKQSVSLFDENRPVVVEVVDRDYQGLGHVMTVFPLNHVQGTIRRAMDSITTSLLVVDSNYLFTREPRWLWPLRDGQTVCKYIDRIVTSDDIVNLRQV